MPARGIPFKFHSGPDSVEPLARRAHGPPEHRAQMFGLFALSGRVTAFLGPAVLAWATHLAANQRAGMATILVFLAVGLALLLKVPEPGRN